MANQVIRLSDGTNNLYPLGKTQVFSLLTSQSITAARNEWQTFNTYSGRKISDYSLIVFCLKASSTDYRSVNILPKVSFDSTSESIILTSLHGSTSEKISNVQFRYVSDTQIEAKWYAFDRSGADASGIRIIEMFGIL
jgi:hypothetical protein